ncbi:hypothetical protein MN116_000813 [Schistosoma mekongi]|uniref:Uncharacterized protein n=1 Tax=Schistosoma mekongi TaxID=38744 RepID=A0AAE1ZKJ9_SCHME|nr:hypothetical protein MN116_000813 [Schistosoma mekongi]
MNAGTNFEQSFNRLAYASKIDIFVGWRPGGNTLWPLSRENLKNIGFPSTITNKLIGVFSYSSSGTIISLELKSFNSQPDDYYWILSARHWQFQFTKIQLMPNRCVPILVLKNCIPIRGFPTYCEGKSTYFTACPLLKTLLETYEFPPNLISFEENCSQDCRLIVGWKYSAWLHCMQCDKHFSSMDPNSHYNDDDNNEKLLKSVNFQMFQNSAITHNSQITAVLFFSPLKILITGDACGTIKIWNMQQVQLAILHGHLSEIIHFSIHKWDLIRPQNFYSTSPSFISISKDGLLKCWQFWQSNYIYSIDNSLKSFSLSEIISNCKTIHTTINEVDSRQTLMNLYSKVMSKTNSSSNTIHIIHDVIMKSNTGDIFLVGVYKNNDSYNIQQKCQEEYYIEHWTLSEPCSPLAEFPQIVKHISFMRLNDLYELVTPEAYKSYSSTKCRNDNSINIAIVICEGKPGSVHLLSTLNGSILTSAVCNDTIEDAVWHWMLEKLYVLQSNGTIAVFSTNSRPCSLLSVWSSPDHDAVYCGPLLLYPVHCPNYFKLFLENDKFTDSVPPIILLFLVGQSDGTLVILCPKEGVVMSKISIDLIRKESGSRSSVDQISRISSIRANPLLGRLYTIMLDGTLKVWQLTTPLPINVKTQRPEIFDQDQSNLRAYFTCFPFKIINNSNIYCIYSAKSDSFLQISNTNASIKTDSCCYHVLCAEVTNQSDTYSIFNFLTTYHLNPVYLNHNNNNTLVKDICNGLTTICTMDRSLLIEQTFLTITVDSIEQQNLFLNVWRITFEYMMNDQHNENSINFKQVSECIKMSIKNEDFNAVNLKCNLKLMNTFRLPFPRGVRASKAVCRIVSIQPNCDILLTINNYIFLLHYNTLNKYLHLRSYLLNLMYQTNENEMIPNILQNVIRQRVCNIDALKKMNEINLSLVSNIRLSANFSSEETNTESSLKKSQVLSNLKERDLDLNGIFKNEFSVIQSKRRTNVDYASIKEAKRIAFNSYYEKILSKQCLNSAPYSVELNIENDEEINLLKDQLSTIEQTYLQIVHETEKKKQVKNKQKITKHRKIDKNSKLFELNEDYSMIKPKEPIKLPMITDNNELDLVPCQRSSGFFSKIILHESGRSKYGWAPNSLLLGKYYTKLTHLNEDKQKKLDETNWIDIKTRLARLNYIELEKPIHESTLTSDSSTDWIIESDKELTMIDIDKTNDNLNEKLLINQYQDVNQSVSISTLQNEINAETVESIQSSEKLKKHTNLTMNKLKQFQSNDNDLLSSLIERQLHDRPKYERENTIFLTEFIKDTHSSKIFFIPDFLQDFKYSRWFSIIGLLNDNEPIGWFNFNAYINPNYFIQWLLWLNILPKICSQSIPPCMIDENVYLCQTITQLCNDLIILYNNYQLSIECIHELHHYLINCLQDIFNKTIEFKGWRMLKSIIELFITFNLHDIDTIIILLILYVKVLFTSEIDDNQYINEIKNEHLLHFIHNTLKSFKFSIKYFNYLEKELNQLKNIEKYVKINQSKKLIHINDCIDLVKNNEKMNYWYKIYKILYIWLENWFKQSDDIILKNKSSKRDHQIKSIHHTTNHPTSRIQSINKEVKLSENNDEIQKEFILKDGIKPLNAFVNWCHEQRLLKLREQAKSEQQLQTDKFKQQINQIKNASYIQTKHDVSQQHKMAMLLPPLNELERCVVRLGESYVTERRKYNKTRNILHPWIIDSQQTKHGDIMTRSQCLRDPTQPSYAQPLKSYKNALTGHFPPRIHIKPTECNILPFDRHQPLKDKLKQKLEEIERLKGSITSFKKQISNLKFNEHMNSQNLVNYEKFLRCLIHDEENKFNSIVQWFMPLMSCLLPLSIKQKNLPVIKLPELCMKLPYEKVVNNGSDDGEEESEMLTKNSIDFSDNFSTELMSLSQND